MKAITLSIAAALITLPTLAFAGDREQEEKYVTYSGPVDLTSVAEMLKDTSWTAEKDVVTEGHLIKQISKDTFIFTDGDAQIQVELDDIVLTQPLNAESKIRLYGEYEGGSTPEIEVEHLQIL
ncbi:NirD/YgiW/YdeI family stress tolerance protein [Vibrio penaeicida]|uniref:YgiW/YdeI family stress tolerance OB fold protein n=1 Tax=Vibrio penaeicida TaxID=104609 RepID=UPI0027342DEF|nr:NirD/YgiW/YdeI family stress tolerance protein [Vibrio penaeicida]MDP2572345.1 NirD/YgiW/YdeI family stress tolerance protein [Vibrio penaeicida]